jgi:hypothetical protein
VAVVVTAVVEDMMVAVDAVAIVLVVVMVMATVIVEMIRQLAVIT